MWVTVTLDNFKFMARDLKFWILEVEGVYYLYRENNGADQLRSTARLICAIVFAYAKKLVSKDATYLSLVLICGLRSLWTISSSSSFKSHVDIVRKTHTKIANAADERRQKKMLETYFSIANCRQFLKTDITQIRLYVIYVLLYKR